MSGVVRQTLWVVKKDLAIEWKSKARLSALLFFSLSTLLVFAFAAGANTQLLRKSAPGYLWLGLLFASVLSLSESFRVESENGALEGLRLWPVDPRALFLGKALANTLLLWGVALVLLPVSVALFDIQLVLPLPWMLLITFGGCLAICAPGTLYSAMVAEARSRDVLLPLLMFPVLTPAIVACTKATALAFTGDAMGELSAWLGLLGAFCVVYWALGFLLFARVIDD